MSMSGQIAVIVVLILANGLLAGAEIAVVAMRASRIDELVGQGSRSARVLRRLRGRPENFLATVQIGITIIGVTAGAFGGASFGDALAQVLARFEPLAAHAATIAFAIVIVSITYLSLILGELVPKSLALRSSERYALMMARPLAALQTITRPAIWILTTSSNAVLRLFGDRTDFLEGRLSLEEVRSMVDDAREGGSIDPGAGQIATRALELGELTASDVMVHRRYVIALPVDADEETVRRVFRKEGHRRIPVYADSIDEVIGYLSWRDVVECAWSNTPIQVRELLRDAYLVPETAPAAPLLREMLAKRQHLAVIVDEHGGMAGIVTLEDLLEELVGEIESEHGARRDVLRAAPDGTTHVAGELTLRDVDRELGTELEGQSSAGTINGLLVELAGDRIPLAGESFLAPDGTRLVVLEASPRRVRKVAVTPGVKPEPEEH